MLRIEVPADQDPAVFAFSQLGSPALLGARAQLMRALYAPGSTLSPREREGVRMRLASFAGCNHCLQMRMDRDMAGFSAEAIPEAFFANILTRDLWDGYSAREAAAIVFAERFVAEPDALNADDGFWRDLDRLFTAAEIGDLCCLCGAWLGAGQTLMVLGLAGHCALTGEDRSAPKMDRILASTPRSGSA